MDLELELESYMPGKFEGWSPRRTYKLGDGTKWKLVKPKTSSQKRNAPRVKLWRDENDRCYLEIVGLHGLVEVSQVM